MHLAGLAASIAQTRVAVPAGKIGGDGGPPGLLGTSTSPPSSLTHPGDPEPPGAHPVLVEAATVILDLDQNAGSAFCTLTCTLSAQTCLAIDVDLGPTRFGRSTACCLRRGRGGDSLLCRRHTASNLSKPAQGRQAGSAGRVALGRGHLWQWTEEGYDLARGPMARNISRAEAPRPSSPEGRRRMGAGRKFCLGAASS